MRQMTSQNEERLVKGIETAIGYTSKGMNPNDAIFKVASEGNFSAPQVDRMVQSFNKTKAVHFMKNAGEDTRSDSFPLASSDDILSRMYEPQQKVASDFCLPTTSFSQADFRHGSMEKVARITDDRMSEYTEKAKQLSALTPASMDNMLRKKAYAVQGVAQRLDDEVALHKHAFEEALTDFVYHLAMVPDFRMKKVAQLIVNGYPTVGPRALDIARARVTRDIPDLQKTANTAILPTAEPFLSLNRTYEQAELWVGAQNRRQSFNKEARGILGTFGANAAANTVASLGQTPESLTKMLVESKKKDKPLEETLDPVYFNRLKGIESIRSMMELGLYDTELSKYDMSDLVSSYNQSVSSVPSAYNKPEALRNLMLRNLQSAGQKDIFELKQEADLEKLYSNEIQDRAKLLREERDREDLPAYTMPAVPRDTTPGLFTTALRGASDILKPQGGSKSTGAGSGSFKEDKDEDPQPAPMQVGVNAVRRQETGLTQEQVGNLYRQYLRNPNSVTGTERAILEHLGLKDRPSGSKNKGKARRQQGVRSGQQHFNTGKK